MMCLAWLSRNPAKPYPTVLFSSLDRLVCSYVNSGRVVWLPMLIPVNTGKAILQPSW